MLVFVYFVYTIFEKQRQDFSENQLYSLKLSLFAKIVTYFYLLFLIFYIYNLSFANAILCIKVSDLLNKLFIFDIFVLKKIIIF